MDTLMPAVVEPSLATCRCQTVVASWSMEDLQFMNSIRSLGDYPHYVTTPCNNTLNKFYFHVDCSVTLFSVQTFLAVLVNLEFDFLL